MSDGRWSLQKIAGDIPEENVPLVQVSGLRKLYPLTTGLFQTSRSYIHAVDDISFTIPHGESLGLVGESGSGKTTTGKLLVRLIDPTEGQIHIYTSTGDTEIANLRGKELKKFRRHVQMIFQDPYESLNPRRTIFDTVAEPLVVQGIGDLAERERRVAELLVWVGLIPPETSMLDVSIRTGIMHLMQGGIDVIVITGDRDAYQLVEDPHIKVLYNRRGVSDYVLYDEAGIFERCGVTPEQYPDYAALRGDTSDNLPGVPGIGEKTAAKLINSYGDLEGILDHLDELPPKQRQNLAEMRDRVLKNREMSRLRRDLDLDIQIDALQQGGWDREHVRVLFDQLEFRTLLPRLFEAVGESAAEDTAADTLEAEVTV